MLNKLLSKTIVICKPMFVIGLYVIFAYIISSFITPIKSVILTNIFIIVTILLTIKHQHTSVLYRKYKKINWKKFVLYFLLFILIYISTQLLSIYMIQNIVDVAFNKYQINISQDYTLTIFAMVILAPIAEELLFRGYLLTQWFSVMNVIVAILLQALFFALLHGTMIHMLPIFLFGVFVGIVYYEFKDVRLTIFFHLMYNVFILFFSSYLNQVIVTSMMFKLILGISVLTLILILFYLDYTSEINLKKRKINTSDM